MKITEIEIKNPKYVFIGKTVFFPKEKILAVGDLHLGFEEVLRSSGMGVPIGLFEEMKKELDKTITYIRARYGKIEEIIFLGDVKHSFGYKTGESKDINQLISFLRKYVENENRIIFIRGNHEKNEKSEKFIDYYIVKDIAFVHGHREFLEIYDKTINLIVMGHIHPSVTLSDEMKIKKEKYKCFLMGRYKKKDFLILPSFISATEGISLQMLEGEGFDFAIVPNSELEDFNVWVCQDVGEEALGFGKLKDL